MNQKENSMLGVYRILELADEKGVYCGKLLADLGADVIKVESSQGDKTRFRGPFYHDEVHQEKSLYFLSTNNNKRSITLNLEHADGQYYFKELIKTADALIETFPPGYLESLGLGYDTLKEINPGLVMCAVTPFGQTGPYKDWKTTDLVSMGMSGLMQITGEPDSEPYSIGGDRSDYIISEYAAAGITMALYHRGNSKKGQYIDISAWECVSPFTVESCPLQSPGLSGLDAVRNGNKGGRIFPWGSFECKDGWVAIAIADDSMWVSLAEWRYEVTGDKELMDEMYGSLFTRWQYKDVLYVLLSEFAKMFDKNEFVVEAQKRSIPILPVNSVEDLMNCPQLNHWGFWVEAEHPVAGKLKYAGAPCLIPDAPWSFRSTAPLLGEHNEDIYCKELGLSKENLAILRSGGVI